MGLFQAIADFAAGRNEAQERFNDGVREMFARGGAPDNIRAEMAQYRAQVDSIANNTDYALIDGVWLDTGSTEYTSWLDAQGW